MGMPFVSQITFSLQAIQPLKLGYLPNGDAFRFPNSIFFASNTTPELGHRSRNDAQHIICVFHPQVERSRDRQFKSVVTVGDRTYSSSLWYNGIRTTTIYYTVFDWCMGRFYNHISLFCLYPVT